MDTSQSKPPPTRSSIKEIKSSQFKDLRQYVEVKYEKRDVKDENGEPVIKDLTECVELKFLESFGAKKDPICNEYKLLVEKYNDMDEGVRDYKAETLEELPVRNTDDSKKKKEKEEKKPKEFKTLLSVVGSYPKRLSRQAKDAIYEIDEMEYEQK